MQTSSMLRIFIPEDQILKRIQESPRPINVILESITGSVFVTGDQTNFEIEPSFAVVEFYLNGDQNIKYIPWYYVIALVILHSCKLHYSLTSSHFLFPKSFSRRIPMAEKSKILIIGGTGYIGKFIVEASVQSGHRTFTLVRESTVSDPAKAKLIDSFKNSGVTLLHGDLNDHESLVKAIKQVDVVISTVAQMQLLDQVKIIAAIKEVGNIKRFFPSEFSNDVDRVNGVEPAETAFAMRAQIRRTIEAEGIPHTYVCSNCFAGYKLPTLAQEGLSAPPRDKAIIPGMEILKV
ncbi:hypothetical protein RHMOL_Rhmol06G0041000 [Rhododendron molle]|uniref:Uncharacterized protein n=1 Tax=Rhododendron molle TaxID=49168 RepID=A0ACC0N8X1_RHOML|nr:hypothetical protein RHMOL_Rhmol06G0041000 [Rhododendron molle]